jgi:Zn-dependent M28 family amino/carboxypeptidase
MQQEPALSWGRIWTLCLIFLCTWSVSEAAMTDLQFNQDNSKQRIEQHLHLLTREIGERSVRRWQNHGQTRAALQEIFQRIGLQTTLETYEYAGTSVANVIAEINPGRQPAQRYLVGAHYDTVAGTVGADDNASGVAVLLELATVLQENRTLVDPALSIRLVAFALEEPPVFSTSYMGSKVHARAMKANREHLTGMICLEMVGFTCHRKGCQSYPFPLQFMNYPKTGDFIGIVGNFRSRKFTAALMDAFRSNPALPAISLSVPFNGWPMPAIRLSDHAPFWDQGFNAVMITDTAFYRNPHYHLSSDTMDTLNPDFMAELVRSLLLFFLAAGGRGS